MPSLTDKDKRALVMGAVGLAVIIAWFGIVEPVGSALVSGRRRSGTGLANLRRLDNRTSRYGARMKELRELMARANLADEPVEEPLQSNRVTDAILKAAKASKIKVKSARSNAPEPLDDFEAYQAVRINVSLDGTFGTLAGFLAKLETTPGVVGVIDIRIAGQSKPGQVTTTLAVMTLAKPPKGEES